MTEAISDGERRTLSVLAYLFFRMGFGERAKRIYAAIADLSAPGSADYRFAKAGVAAAALDLGDAAGALAALKDIPRADTLSSKEAALHLLRAQALWRLGREEEARAARDEYLRLAGGAQAALSRSAVRSEGAPQP